MRGGNSDDLTGIVASLPGVVPPGSYLMVAHPASDVSVGQVPAATYRISPVMAAAVALRNGQRSQAITAQTTFPVEFSGA